MTSAAGGTGPVAEFTGRTGVVLERLNRLYPSLIDLSLGRLEALLARLGNPEEKLPPVVHVAGTNGKGSTCATLRALGEASGWRVHVTSSPHLVDVRERFRVAGTLVSENDLIAILEEIERVNDGAPITVFEVLTAAAFLLFSRTPADLAVIEVGLGGRFDATNVLRHPAVCAITPVSLDHEAFLGNTIEAIAAEKAGIMKPGVPVVCAPQDPRSIPVFEAEAARLGAPLWLHGRDWSAVRSGDAVLYRDVHGELKLPLPALPGDHQILNAGLAVAALRAAGMPVPEQGWQGVGRTVWPARLQKLEGDLAQTLPTGWELWLDGGHNPGAGEVLSSQLKTWSDRPLHVIVGMKQTKDAAGFIRPLLPYVTSIYAVQEAQQHMALPVAQILAAGGEKVQPGPTIAAALDKIRQQNDGPARVLICGSLYLAGVVLKRDGWVVV